MHKLGTFFVPEGLGSQGLLVFSELVLHSRLNNRRSIKYLSCLLMLLALGGCASSSLFLSYPEQARAYQAMLPAPSASDVASFDSRESNGGTSREIDGPDALLHYLERGRVTQLAGDFELSKAYFERAIEAFEAQDLAARFQLSSAYQQGAAVLSNDNAIRYSGAGYERILSHHYQAFNYLGLGLPQEAAVEFRKAALEQDVLLAQHQQELEQAYAEADAQGLALADLSSDLPLLPLARADIKNSFQNAYSYYASAAFWEARGERNRALVDYRRVAELAPEWDYIATDIARLSGASAQLYPLENKASLVIFYEQGLVPAKTQVGLNLWLPGPDQFKSLSISMPHYPAQRWPHTQPLSVRDTAFNDYGLTQPLMDVSTLAIKALEEQRPKLWLRQILRAFAKNELRRQTDKEFGPAGSLIATLYNVASEQADRRSWLTLPHSVQVKRLALMAGRHELILSARDRAAAQDIQRTVPLSLRAGETKFLRVVQANNELNTQVFSLQ